MAENSSNNTKAAIESSATSPQREVADEILANFDPFALPTDNYVSPFNIWSEGRKVSNLPSAEPGPLPLADAVEVVRSKPGDMFRVVPVKSSKLRSW